MRICFVLRSYNQPFRLHIFNLHSRSFCSAATPNIRLASSGTPFLLRLMRGHQLRRCVAVHYLRSIRRGWLAALAATALCFWTAPCGVQGLTAGAAPAARWGSGFVATSGGTVYLFGGQCGQGEKTSVKSFFSEERLFSGHTHRSCLLIPYAAVAAFVLPDAIYSPVLVCFCRCCTPATL